MMARIDLNEKHYEYAINDRYAELEKKIKKDIDNKYGQCRRIIAKAKWQNKFSSGRKLSDSFGRWNR